MLSVNGVLLKVDKQNVGKVVSKIKMAVTTTVNEVDLKKTCRICLMKNKSEDLFCLFTSNKMFSDLTISTAILDCFGVPLQQDEDLPNYVCIKCASTTLQAYTFKKCLLKCQGYLMKEKFKEKTKEQTVINEVNGSMQTIPVAVLNEIPVTEIPLKTDEFIEEEYIEYSEEAVLEDEQMDDQISVNFVQDDHNYSKPTEIKTEVEDFQDLTPEVILNQNGNEDDGTNIIVPIEDFLQKINMEAKRNKIISKKSKLRSSGPPYECKICGKNYGVKFNSFYLHVRLHNIQKQICEHCGKTFMRNKLLRHMRTHTNEKPYSCDHCSARFTIQGNLKRHLRCHTGEKLYVCDICGKALTQSSTLLSHRQRHLGEIRHVCAYCGKTFTSDNSYSAHVHQVHNKEKIKKEEPIEIDDLAIYPCELCGRVFNKAFSLRIHLRWHESKKYFCDICKKMFRLHCNFTVHKFWHEIDMLEFLITPTKCKFCDEAYTDKDEFLDHILKHMELPFSCKICNKPFASKATLKFHMRCHSDKRPFDCPQCPKNFRSKATLMQHLKVHSGEKPYQCDVCAKRFAQQQQLNSHGLIHTGEKRHVCPFCGKAFTLNGNLTVHIRRHTGETPHSCDVCGKGFYDTSSRKRHKETKHSVKVERIAYDPLIKKYDF